MTAPVVGQQTYAAAIAGLVTGAGATDVFTIAGSATKTVKVTKIVVTGTQSASSTPDVTIIKRSTADTGGTSTSPTAVPYDSADLAATAVVKAYTANPAALGTAVGTVAVAKGSIETTADPVFPTVFTFGGVSGGKPVVLHGVAEVLAVNFGAVTITSSIDIFVEWTEE